MVLAHLLAEDRAPADAFWQQDLVASRLVEHEAWTRLHRQGLGTTHGPPLRETLARIGMIELSPVVLARATEPFPVPVRTLDALHLATCSFLQHKVGRVHLATYDVRLRDAATAIDVPVIEP